MKDLTCLYAYIRLRYILGSPDNLGAVRYTLSRECPEQVTENQSLWLGELRPHREILNARVLFSASWDAVIWVSHPDVESMSQSPQR